MDTTGLIIAAKKHARVDHSDEDGLIEMMLQTAAQDVAHAAQYTLPETIETLPDDLRFAIIDQAAMLYDARGIDTERPLGLSMAATRITARYRGVSLGQAPESA